MALHQFDPRIDKVLADVYINVEDGTPDKLGASERGIALLPLLDADYGPAGEVIEISNRQPNGQRTKLGHDIFDDTPAMKMVRLALENAVTLKLYIPAQGAKAKAEGTADTDGNVLSAEARYGGSRGNDISYAILANPTGGFDVNVYLAGELVELFEGMKTVADLVVQESQYILFSGNGDLAATAGVALTGGTTATVTNEDMNAFLDAMDDIRFTTLAFPVTGHKMGDVDNTALLKALTNKIIEIRNKGHKMVRAVVPEYAANNESIINVTNGWYESDDTIVTPVVATAWLAGLDCSSTNTQSNTYVQVPNAVKVYKPKTIEQQEIATLAGELFFKTNDDDQVIIAKDINSLTDFEKPNCEAYSHNIIMRVIDTLCEAIRAEFPPARFANDSKGWDLMDGLGAAILDQFENDGAIHDVEKGDFAVDRTRSEGDRTYYDVRIRPTDRGEKLYFTVKTLGKE